MPGTSQRRIPPKLISPTRSRRRTYASASVAVARTARSSVPSSPSRASANESTNRITSVFRSGWLSFTHRSPRRALARQLTRFSGSPGVQSRMSANSIPSPFARATSLPVKTCVSARREHAPQHLLARVRAQLGPRVGRRPPRRAARADRARAGTSGRSRGRPSATARSVSSSSRRSPARRRRPTGFRPCASSTPSGRRT